MKKTFDDLYSKLCAVKAQIKTLPRIFNTENTEKFKKIVNQPYLWVSFVQQEKVIVYQDFEKQFWKVC